MQINEIHVILRTASWSQMFPEQYTALLFWAVWSTAYQRWRSQLGRRPTNHVLTHTWLIWFTTLRYATDLQLFTNNGASNMVQNMTMRLHECTNFWYSFCVQNVPVYMSRKVKRINPELKGKVSRHQLWLCTRTLVHYRCNVGCLHYSKVQYSGAVCLERGEKLGLDRGVYSVEHIPTSCVVLSFCTGHHLKHLETVRGKPIFQR